MPSPYELMIRGANYKEVVQATAGLSDEELTSFVTDLSAEQLVEIAVYTATNYRQLGMKKTLVTGCLFHLFSIAVEVDGRQEFIENLLNDLEISRTQAYRSRQAWRCYGTQLLAEPKLTKQFVSEAVKLLSAETVPEAAREESLELARDGQRINIKTARSLLKKHGVELETQPGDSSSTATSSTSRTNWLFSGKLVRVQLLPTISLQRSNVEALIRELQSVIQSLQSQTQQPPLSQAHLG